MQFIYKQISTYLDQEGVTYFHLSEDDIKELASDGPSSTIASASHATLTNRAAKSDIVVQFLGLIIQITISPPKAHIIEKIPTLPHPTPEVISNLIQQLDSSQSSSDLEDNQENGGSGPDQKSWEESAASSPTPNTNSVFHLEEELFKVTAQLKRRDGEIEGLRLERQALDDAYERLNESYEAVKKQSAENVDELKRLALANNERDQWSPKELEDKISQQEEVIRGHESQNKDHQSREAELRRIVNKLSDTESKFQELKDEFHIQKGQLDEQTKKANAGEKYKQKVQASQAIEKERDALRSQFEEARPKLHAYDEIKRHNARLEKENQEIHRTLSQSERDNSQLRETKQSVIAENDRLRHESTAMREALARNLERIAELEDGSGGSEIHSSPTVVNGGLESELSETSKHEQQMQVAGTLLWWARGLMQARKSRIAELEKENGHLASEASEKDSKAIVLQRQLENAQDQSADQSVKEQTLRQDLSSLESSMSEVRRGHPIEGSVSPNRSIVELAYAFERTEIFRRLRAQLKEEQKKSGELEEKLSIVEKDLEAAINNCTSAYERHCMMVELNIDLLQGDLVDKPKLEMVEQVKRQYSVELVQLRSEHDALWKRYNRLQEEFEKQWEERNQVWRESHDLVLAKAQAESDNAATWHVHQQLTDSIKQASKDTAESIKNSTDVSQQNLQIITTKFEEGYATQINGSRERLAVAQQVDQRLFVPDRTFPAFPSSTPKSPSFQGVRRFFGSKDADKITISENREARRHHQRSRSPYPTAPL